MKHHLLYDWKDNEFRFITDIFGSDDRPRKRPKTAQELKQERIAKLEEETRQLESTLEMWDYELEKYKEIDDRLNSIG